MNADLCILGGSASARLTADVCEQLARTPDACETRRFPDGELQVELGQSVRGRDVFLVQSTSPPVESHLFELLLMADACRRAGAARLTAVIPYFGYARQDRRVGRRSLGARVAADVIAAASIDRVMLLDAHTPAIEGFFPIPVEHLTAVPLLASAVRPWVRDHSVIVAPDLGAVKLARAYARLLDLPIAVIHKTRLSGEEVEAHEVIGSVRGHAPIIVDDMVSTGATVEAAARALLAAGAIEPIVLVVTHALFVGDAEQRLAKLPLTRVIATDSVTRERALNLPFELTGLGRLLATALGRAHREESLSDLRSGE